MLYVPCALWLDLDHVSLLTEENISLSIFFFFFLSFLFRASNFSAVLAKKHQHTIKEILLKVQK